MAHKSQTLNEAQARLEHKMAVNRDYIFQPRMCKYSACQRLLLKTLTNALDYSIQDCVWCKWSFGNFG